MYGDNINLFLMTISVEKITLTVDTLWDDTPCGNADYSGKLILQVYDKWTWKKIFLHSYKVEQLQVTRTSYRKNKYLPTEYSGHKSFKQKHTLIYSIQLILVQ